MEDIEKNRAHGSCYRPSRLAGLKPAGVIVEIMNEDGSMARVPDLIKVAKKFDLKIIN